MGLEVALARTRWMELEEELLLGRCREGASVGRRTAGTYRGVLGGLSCRENWELFPGDVDVETLRGEVGDTVDGVVLLEEEAVEW